MFTISTLSSFVVIVLGLFVIPGPAVLLVATRTAQNGRKAGVMSGLGIATGDLIHTLFTAVGLSAILMTSAMAFNIVKFVGAAYLVYLGIRAILEKTTGNQLQNATPESKLSPYSQAILIEVLNPKTALFFLSFLPQFVNPSHGSSLLQLLTLGLIFVMLSAIYTTFFAISVRLIMRVTKRISWIGRWTGKIVGIIYIALGLKVATQNQ